MNTQNNTEEKIYLISFGNSNQYVVRDTEAGEKSRLMKIESELNEYLREKFPDETFSYFTSPRVEELGDNGAEALEKYDALDDKAIENIKKVLSVEVENMAANKKLDSDAPFANVNPAAADLPNII